MRKIILTRIIEKSKLCRVLYCSESNKKEIRKLFKDNYKLYNYYNFNNTQLNIDIFELFKNGFIIMEDIRIEEMHPYETLDINAEFKYNKHLATFKFKELEENINNDRNKRNT